MELWGIIYKDIPPSKITFFFMRFSNYSSKMGVRKKAFSGGILFI
jgi:hypothetical protein